jgi:hypothetical protein
MPSAEGLRGAVAATLAALLLAACGGGNSTETTLIVGGQPAGPTGVEVDITSPQGANTTEILVDSGPSGVATLGVANLPYVTVTVCTPGSATACVTIDHVFLDTGSIGLRLLRSTVASLNLPAMAAPGGGSAVECYPFVIGAVWGALAQADVRIGGEAAAGLPVQLIDDRATPQPAPTADCQAAANGGLIQSATALQAKGVLGVGMLAYDCGLVCDSGDYSGGYTLYYACDASGACKASAMPAAQQLQNPVSYFAQDNNGTLVVLPALPATGAAVVRGRLVFGIGTQANNQLPAAGTTLQMQTDPASPGYLYVATSTAGTAYPYSYFDSGSNGLFFDDATLSTTCSGAGSGGSWYCPATTQSRSVTVTDPYGTQATVALSIASADVLFASANTAFANLGGAAGSGNPGAFVFGLPFFFGRSVYTSIWGQALARNGPWVAF